MRPLKHELLWAGVVYFLVLLGIALWVRDIPNQPDAFITIQQLIKTRGWSDSVYFATAAIDIAENGWISSANDWIFNLWPPGFVLLEALGLKVLGHEAPVIFVLQLLATVLYSIVLALLYDILGKCVKTKVAFALPLLIFAFPVSRVFLLEPTGISLGESILLAFRSVARSSLRYAVYAGVFLALSAYFRSQFELILLAMTGWGVLLIMAIRLTRLRKSIEPQLAKSAVKTIAVMLLVAHAATVPWRTYHWIYQGNPSWVQTANLVFENSVKTSAQLAGSAGFIVAGGGNLVCRIDPSTCGDTANAKKLFIKTFIAHPIEWYALKFDVIGQYWFSSVNFWVNSPSEPALIDIVANGLLLNALIALAALLLTRRVRSHGLWILLMWFNLSIFSAYMLIFTMVHFEVRYFYFPKIVGIVMLIFVGSLYFRPIQKNDEICVKDSI
jgi:hypothetical protein